MYRSERCHGVDQISGRAGEKRLEKCNLTPEGFVIALHSQISCWQVRYMSSPKILVASHDASSGGNGRPSRPSPRWVVLM